METVGSFVNRTTSLSNPVFICVFEFAKANFHLMRMRVEPAFHQHQVFSPSGMFENMED